MAWELYLTKSILSFVTSLITYMLSYKKLFIFVALILLSKVSFGQGEIAILPVYNPSHLQLKISSGGRSLSGANFITSADKNLEIEAFSDTEDQLVIKDVQVDLVRGGRKVASKKMSNKADLTDLIAVAKKDDVFRFEVEEVFIKNEEGKLELYSIGKVSFIYEYQHPTKLALN